MENPQCASGRRGGKRGFGMIGGAELNDKTQKPAFLIIVKNISLNISDLSNYFLPF